MSVTFTGEPFDEILGGDAGDEVAHVCDGDEGPSLHQTPATDPAPAVCVWTHRGVNEPGFYSTPHGLCHINHLPKSGGCWCGNPIKFTEVK